MDPEELKKQQEAEAAGEVKADEAEVAEDETNADAPDEPAEAEIDGQVDATAEGEADAEAEGESSEDDEAEAEAEGEGEDEAEDKGEDAGDEAETELKAKVEKVEKAISDLRAQIAEKDAKIAAAPRFAMFIAEKSEGDEIADEYAAAFKGL